MKSKTLIGTSGYAYREWKKKFYPAELKSDDWLRYYAERFATVEINSSFYRMPDPKVLSAWAAKVPATFQFSFKAPQIITHFKKLRGVEKDVNQFVAATGILKKRRGPLLFQLPPWVKLDLPLLQDFLALLPAAPCAFEFRHPSWFTDEVEAVLRKAKRPLCFNDADVENCPVWTTAAWSYWRLRRVTYAPADLTRIAARLAATAAARRFVYFKHEDSASAPRLATALTEKLS